MQQRSSAGLELGMSWFMVSFLTPKPQGHPQTLVAVEVTKFFFFPYSHLSLLFDYHKLPV